MYAWGNARFCRVQENDSWFYLVFNFPETLTNFCSEKNPTWSCSASLMRTSKQQSLGRLSVKQRGHCFRKCRVIQAQDLVKHGWDFSIVNFNKIRRILLYLMNIHHKYHCCSKNTLLYCSLKCSSGKAVAKYKKGSSDSQVVVSVAWDMFSQGVISEINYIIFMLSINWKLAY